MGDYEHEVLIRSRPRWRFGSFAAMGKGTRRPQAAKLPLRQTKLLYHRPLIRPSVRTGAPSPQGEGFKRGRRPPWDQERSSFSKASKARLDSSAFLFRFPLTRYPRGGMSPKFTFIG